jgi:hypothetical protein
VNSRNLIALAVLLGLINPIAAITTAVENTPNSEPVMLALFVIPWLIGAELVRRGKLVVGGVVLSLLSLVNIVSFPGWRRDSAADWTEQIVSGAAAVLCLGLAVTLMARRNRHSLATS